MTTRLLSIIFLCFIGLFNTSFGQSKDYHEWYLRTPDSLDVYNQDIYVRELGTGKDTVIVVHGGFGANHDYMLDAIKGLEKKYHFVLYDQRGSLLSPAPKEKLTFQKNVGDLDLLIKQLGTQKVKIMAHSMGTLVAMEYLNQHPEKVSNLVLIGAILSKSDSIGSVFSKRSNEQVKFLSTRQEIKDLPIYKRYKELNGKFSSDRERTDFNRMAFAMSNIYKIDRYQLMRGGFHYYKADASVMVETVNWKYDYRKQLHDNTKTTIIFGDYDFLDFNGTIHQELIKDFKNIHFKLIKSAGHNIWIDQPEVFRKELDLALKK
ncbi:alpha/beta hydrolase [Paenimyroides tangerinum]|uniref:Alpha/beta hydrolase n=1 Tax=Paenimyroides tangerinum TaxID=2488728 RepID=A0A3P3WFC9_9FLAO|nr:alpha/beta hydrolase [Paenimyroides tangerinum]RRJ92746.1 alpha/beta hydrolase [Paenimyroides tangerinum]